MMPSVEAQGSKSHELAKSLYGKGIARLSCVICVNELSSEGSCYCVTLS